MTTGTCGGLTTCAWPPPTPWPSQLRPTDTMSNGHPMTCDGSMTSPMRNGPTHARQLARVRCARDVLEAAGLNRPPSGISVDIGRPRLAAGALRVVGRLRLRFSMCAQSSETWRNIARNSSRKPMLSVPSLSDRAPPEGTDPKIGFLAELEPPVPNLNQTQPSTQASKHIYNRPQPRISGRPSGQRHGNAKRSNVNGRPKSATQLPHIPNSIICRTKSYLGIPATMCGPRVRLCSPTYRSETL